MAEHARPAGPGRSTPARSAWIARCVAALLVLAALPVLAAPALAPLESRTLPAPHGDTRALVALGDTLLAVGADGAARLGAGASAWSPPQPLPLPAGTRLVASATDGSQAWLLLAPGDAPADRIARLTADAAGAVPVLALRDTRELPVPLANAVLAVGDGGPVVAGHDAGGRLQVVARDTNGGWTTLPAWPGGMPASALAASAGRVYATVPANVATELWAWSRDAGWQPGPAPPGTRAPWSVRAIGQSHLLAVFPADDGTAATATWNTITGAWSPLSPLPLPEGAAVAMLGDGLAWAGDGVAGEATFRAPSLLLTWPDWTVIVVYLLAMAGIGAFFWLREQRASTDSFFVGSRAIPFWAAGVSLYATNVSSISFIAIPAKAFESNWTYLANNLIAILGLVFVAIWIVPLLRRLDLVSVFSYLETRFHPGIRMLASAMCIATQVGSRMSVVLFLPALAIASITGLDVVWSILMMGVFTILYTTLGGMKAVIWTDFAQVFVMFGGALFAIVFILAGVDGSAFDAVSYAVEQGKTHTFDFDFDLAKATVWGFIFLVLFDVVLTFPKDQVLMQRVLSTKSAKEAGRSIWLFAAMMIPGGLLFYGIGTALWLYYRDHPERMNPMLPIDATFPLFIAAELPAGVTGLIIAGIFAAAMSTLSSILNSVSTMATVDFHDRLAKNPTPEQSVRFAEWTGVVVGVVGIGLALVLSRFDIRSLFDVSIELLGLLGGGFAGAYTLGMFTRRANSQGVAIGICVSLVATFAIWTLRIVHPYLYLGISIAICIVVGYVASLFFPPPSQSLAGLTIHDRVPDGAAAD